MIVRNILQNIFNLAVQYCAKVVQCDGADRFVVLQSVKQTSADVKLFDQSVCCNPFVFHRFIERGIIDHSSHHIKR